MKQMKQMKPFGDYLSNFQTQQDMSYHSLISPKVLNSHGTRTQETNYRKPRNQNRNYREQIVHLDQNHSPRQEKRVKNKEVKKGQGRGNGGIMGFGLQNLKCITFLPCWANQGSRP